MNLTDIKKTIWGAFGYVYMFRKSFAKALLLPITMLVMLEIFIIDEPGIPVVILSNLLYLLIYTVLAVTTHRIILLGPDAVSEWGVYLPGKREIIFLLYSIGIGLLMMPFGLLVIIPTIGYAIAIVAAIYMMARLSLVFPAIATDKSFSFYDSWYATKNHQVLMIIVVAIFPFIISIPEILLFDVPYMSLLASLISAFTMIFVVSALSVAYQVVSQKEE